MGVAPPRLKLPPPPLLSPRLKLPPSCPKPQEVTAAGFPLLFSFFLLCVWLREGRSHGRLASNKKLNFKEYLASLELIFVPHFGWNTLLMWLQKAHKIAQNKINFLEGDYSPPPLLPPKKNLKWYPDQIKGAGNGKNWHFAKEPTPRLRTYELRSQEKKKKSIRTKSKNEQTPHTVLQKRQYLQKHGPPPPPPLNPYMEGGREFLIGNKTT